jgi:hypothetical protein
MDNLIFSNELALTNKDLENFCKKNNLSFKIVDLSEINNLNTKYAFIFTGDKKNSINKGHDHHWMFICGQLIFDSYGNPNSYEIPDNFSMIKNFPRQLQEYNSTVCGEYCCLFYKFIEKNQDLPESEIGEEFSNEYGFTKNRRKNDKIAFELYREELN